MRYALEKQDRALCKPDKKLAENKRVVYILAMSEFDQRWMSSELVGHIFRAGLKDATYWPRSKYETIRLFPDVLGIHGRPDGRYYSLHDLIVLCCYMRAVDGLGYKMNRAAAIAAIARDIIDQGIYPRSRRDAIAWTELDEVYPGDWLDDIHPADRMAGRFWALGGDYDQFKRFYLNHVRWMMPDEVGGSYGKFDRREP